MKALLNFVEIAVVLAGTAGVAILLACAFVNRTLKLVEGDSIAPLEELKQ